MTQAKKHKRYQDQAQEIQILAMSLIKKSRHFANQKHNSEWYQDLEAIVGELQELDHFLQIKEKPKPVPGFHTTHY